MTIPRYFFQTSFDAPHPALVAHQARFCVGWEYQHFTDPQCLQFFADHPLPDFPLVADRFHRFQGAHKADLFRYYVLYVRGGVFLDSDALLFHPLDNIVRGDFFTVESHYVENTVFQGFLGCVPGHPLMREALQDAYDMNVALLDINYHLFCYNLRQMIRRSPFTVHLYHERPHGEGSAEVYGEKVWAIHYFRGTLRCAGLPLAPSTVGYEGSETGEEVTGGDMSGTSITVPPAPTFDFMLCNKGDCPYCDQVHALC